MSESGETPPGWFDDPLGVGELRYWDGSRWTEHVSTDGVAWISYVVRRDAQARDAQEAPLLVLAGGEAIGQWTPTLEGAPGYRYADVAGTPGLAAHKPGAKAAVEISGQSAAPIGTITRIGRLNSRYDLVAGSARLALRPTGESDGWEGRTDGALTMSVERRELAPGDALTFVAVEYAVLTRADVDERLRQLALAMPIALDMLDTQLVT